MTLEPSQKTFWTETELPLTSSAEGSHAKTSARPANRLELTLVQDQVYGLKSSGWLSNYDQNSSSWRTSQICLEAHLRNQGDGLAEFLGIWPNAGLMQNGKTYQRRPWAHLTLGSVYGLLPTPTATDWKRTPVTNYYAFRPITHNQVDTLSQFVARSCQCGKKNHRLEPLFVERLMGFPTGWTDLKPSETP